MKKQMSVETLKQLIAYDPKTGMIKRQYSMAIMLTMVETSSFRRTFKAVKELK